MKLGASVDPVVAMIPAYRRAGSVAATIAAVGEIDGVDQIVVVDDGSDDGTADAAEAAGADSVVRLATNQGKGAAVTAGVSLLRSLLRTCRIDGDVGSTGTAIGALLEFVRYGQADLAVGILPSAGRRGGFGFIKGLAR